jgi:hypothetical protein
VSTTQPLSPHSPYLHTTLMSTQPLSPHSPYFHTALISTRLLSPHSPYLHTALISTRPHVISCPTNLSVTDLPASHHMPQYLVYIIIIIISSLPYGKSLASFKSSVIPILGLPLGFLPTILPCITSFNKLLPLPCITCHPILFPIQYYLYNTSLFTYRG